MRFRNSVVTLVRHEVTIPKALVGAAFAEGDRRMILPVIGQPSFGGLHYSNVSAIRTRPKSPRPAELRNSASPFSTFYDTNSP
jgi:hypothetical protein